MLLTLSGIAQARGTDTTTEITGEASVVIYDDFARGGSESRHYIIGRAKNPESRVFFNKSKPRAFATGKKVKVRGRGRSGGLEVESVTGMNDGDDTGQDRVALLVPV